MDNRNCDTDDFAGDILKGADDIRDFLKSLGLSDLDKAAVYYIAKKKKLPISKFGKNLIASKRRLVRALTTI